MGRVEYDQSDGGGEGEGYVRGYNISFDIDDRKLEKCFHSVCHTTATHTRHDIKAPVADSSFPFPIPIPIPIRIFGPIIIHTFTSSSI